MNRRYARVLDTSAIVAVFDAYRPLLRLLAHAEAGAVDVFLPVVCVAEAGTLLGTSVGAWDGPLLLAPGVHDLRFSLTAAVEVASWPGPLGARHAAWEARHLRGAVVTREPSWYQGMQVDLSVL